MDSSSGLWGPETEQRSQAGEVLEQQNQVQQLVAAGAQNRHILTHLVRKGREEEAPGAPKGARQ